MTDSNEDTQQAVKTEEKKEPHNDRLDGLNAQCFIINEG